MTTQPLSLQPFVSKVDYNQGLLKWPIRFDQMMILFLRLSNKSLGFFKLATNYKERSQFKAKHKGF